MNVDEVATLFYQYIDEPNRNFVTGAGQDASLYLLLGYEEMKNVISAIDPEAFLLAVDLPFVNQDLYELDGANPATVFFGGAGVTHFAQKFVQLATVRAGRTVFEWRAANSMLQVNTQARGWRISGVNLIIGSLFTGTLRLFYTAALNEDFSDLTTAAQHIDDFQYAHDYIALRAARHYGIRDNARSAEIAEWEQRRKMEIEDYTRNRSGRGSNYVQRVDRSYGRPI
jgi:hypothetical protein